MFGGHFVYGEVFVPGVVDGNVADVGGEAKTEPVGIGFDQEVELLGKGDFDLGRLRVGHGTIIALIRYFLGTYEESP